MTIQKVNTSRNTATRSTYVGEKGRLFYDEANGTLYISDGSTPGGSSIFNKLVNGNYSATLDSSGNFTVPGNLTVQGTTTTVVNETITNNETLTGTLTVSGNATLNGTVNTLTNANLIGTGQNFLVYSNQIGNNQYGLNGTASVQLNSATDPLAGTTATTITGASDMLWGGNNVRQIFTSLTNTQYTFSCYLKLGTATTVSIGLRDNTTGNLPTTAFTTSGVWQRVSVTMTTGATTTNPAIMLGSANGTFYAWGAQVNFGATAGTFIATTNAPIAGYPAINFSASASIKMDASGNLLVAPGGSGAIQLGNTAGNYIQISSAASGTSPVISVVGVDPYPSLYLLAKSAPLILGTRSGTSGSFQILDIGQAPTNILRVSASTTGLTPSMSVSGTDPNIGLLFQSKNTGAIDLAAGSSGINISNGNTVTSIVKVSDSLNYTSFPTSVTISNPTTAGGTAATAAVQYMYVLTPTIVSGGTGYSVNDVITFLGGTPRTTGATFNVSSIGALGAITGVTRNATGGFNDYTALPTNPVSVSVAPTGGSGATFNLNYGFAAITLLTAGSGYIETPTITISGGGGTPGSFYAVIGSGTIIRGVGSTSSFYTPSGEVLRLTSSGTNNTNYISIQGDGSGNTPTISSTQNLRFTTGGTASIIFSTNYSGQTELVVSHTASAVNYLQVTGGATGTGPTISAQGSDVGSINLNYVTKNTYASHIFSGAQGLQFQITGPANGTYSSNRFIVYSSATGSSPVFGVTGADPNIDINIQTKGTGSVNITGNLTLNGGGAVSTINKLQTQSFGGF